MLLSMVFILSTLGLWRLHCETLRTQCKACLSLLGCEYILMCTSMSHTQKKNYQYWQKGYLHKSIYTPASCDVSVYQYQCTALKLADIFLISEPQIIPTTFFPALYSPVLIDVHLPALKTSFKCPPPLPQSTQALWSAFWIARLWGLVLSSVQEKKHKSEPLPFFGEI